MTFNNAREVVKTLGPQTVPIIVDWFAFIDNFKQRYALRRCIFGLAGLISLQNMPEDIKNRLSDIGRIIIKVCLRVNKWRRELLLEKK